MRTPTNNIKDYHKFSMNYWLIKTYGTIDPKPHGVSSPIVVEHKPI